MALSESELDRFRVGRVVGVADVLFMLAFLDGVLAAYLLILGWVWQGFVALAVLPLLVLLFQYNVRSYFREANGK